MDIIKEVWKDIHRLEKKEEFTLGRGNQEREEIAGIQYKNFRNLTQIKDK